MKELWVKKTIWRRYLINDELAKNIDTEFIEDKTGLELIEEVYDENDSIEYDNEKLLIPAQFEVKNIGQGGKI